MRLTFSVALALLTFVLASDTASAYPQFQLATGNTRCSACHYSPSGGGLLNDYGRSESADTVSLLGGEGRFLYGAYEEPQWLRLGADFRLAGLVRDRGLGTDTHVFPMQGDTYLRLRTDAFSLYAALGLRAQVRDDRKSALDRLASREHYLMWQPRSRGLLVRVGRFHAPFGLRLADHTTYVRRDLGLGVFEETYNVSAAHLGERHELHLTAFTSLATRFTEAGSQREVGVAAYFERILGDHEKSAAAAQARVARGAESTRSFFGVVGKHYLASLRTLVLAELDLGLQTFAFEPARARGQLASYLGATWFAMRGLLVTAAHERYDEDLRIENLERDAVSLTVQLFPWAKWEIWLLGKVETAGTVSRRTSLGMLQLHYYL